MIRYAVSMDSVEIRPKILYYGTPVALLVTENADETFNLAPMSSSWTLGYTIVLGLGESSQTSANLRARPQLTINFPSPELYEAVERLAPLTGRDPVPEEKRAQFRTERRKFEASGLTPVASNEVRPPRVAECPLQMEASVATIHSASDPQVKALIVEAHVHRVHAHPNIVQGESHIDVSEWHPLLYVYRHYFGRGGYLGPTFRADTKLERLSSHTG